MGIFFKSVVRLAIAGSLCFALPSFAGAQVPLCDGKPVTVDLNTNGGAGFGTSGDDVILGTPGPDTINGLAGDDTICADAGDDIVFAGSGNDRVLGGAGADSLYGSTGNDYLNGGEGDDLILGQGGHDRAYGLGGVDKIKGMSGNDYIFGGNDGDKLFGNGGVDKIWGGAGLDQIWGGNLGDFLYGQGTRDIINGGGGADIIEGGAGDDVLAGNANDDELTGGGGNDTFDGGTGRDTCHDAASHEATTGCLPDETCDIRFHTPACTRVFFSSTTVVAGFDPSNVIETSIPCRTQAASLHLSVNALLGGGSATMSFTLPRGGTLMFDATHWKDPSDERPGVPTNRGNWGFDFEVTDRSGVVVDESGGFVGITEYYWTQESYERASAFKWTNYTDETELILRAKRPTVVSITPEENARTTLHTPRLIDVLGSITGVPGADLAPEVCALECKNAGGAVHFPLAEQVRGADFGGCLGPTPPACEDPLSNTAGPVFDLAGPLSEASVTVLAGTAPAANPAAAVMGKILGDVIGDSADTLCNFAAVL